MKKILILLNFLFLIPIYLYGQEYVKELNSVSGAPPNGVSKEEALSINKYDWIFNWKRPEGPAKVALQAGHYNNDDFPDELSKLRNNNGSSGGGYSEWEVNLEIAELTAEILRERGVEVEILPATVPPSYWADAFIAIHADGSNDPYKRGYKIAEPWRDFSGTADDLVRFITESYSEATGFTWDPNITRNMRGYYAFSFWRFEHAIHPMTTAAIVETGFLTNYDDRRFLTETPELAAEGIANGVISYLQNEGLVIN